MRRADGGTRVVLAPDDRVERLARHRLESRDAAHRQQEDAEGYPGQHQRTPPSRPADVLVRRGADGSVISVRATGLAVGQAGWLASARDGMVGAPPADLGRTAGAHPAGFGGTARRRPAGLAGLGGLGRFDLVRRDGARSCLRCSFSRQSPVGLVRPRAPQRNTAAR
jgi:hypothetical protein